MSDVHQSTIAQTRRLNHVEFLHRPGEGKMVIDLFEALGCPWYEVDVAPFGKYVVIQMDKEPGENDIFVSEAEPEQIALDNALQSQIDSGNGTLASALAQFRQMQKNRPFRASHIGIRIPSVRELDGVIERLSALGAGTHAGRLDLGTTLSRSAEEAAEMSAPVKQIWVWTDVISTGVLAVGQQIELQAYNY